MSYDLPVPLEEDRTVKKVLAIVVGVFAVGVVAVLAIAATKPDDFRVERSATINATPQEIYPHINNYKEWAAWSPWEKVDPNMKRTYSGPESGKGAKYAWVGNNDVGEGDMEILESDPSKIDIKLHFVKPFEDTSIATFTMQPQGPATKVTWAMAGKSQFPCKVMMVFMNMDEMCGKDFEKGLVALKTVSEHSATANSPETPVPAKAQ